MMRTYIPKPLVSVIMPCSIQHPNVLQRAVNSLVLQSWPSWELIVVEHGSSGNRCGQNVWHHAVKNKINTFVHEALTVLGDMNLDRDDSRNVGVRQARGVWVLVLNPDRVIRSDFLLKAERNMTLEPRVQHIVHDRLARQDTPMFMYRKTMWQHVGGYNNSLQGQDQDIDFWNKLEHPE